MNNIPNTLVIVSNYGKANQKFLAVDRSSGGYPYLTDFVHQAQFWPNNAEAQTYMEMFKNVDYAPNLSLHLLSFTLSPSLTN